MSVTAAELATALNAFEGAFFGGGSSEAIKAAQHELMRLEEASETLAQRAVRLERMAGDKDAEGERHMKAAADAAGLAAGRRLKGNNDEFARSYDREELVCTKLAAACMAEAERLRSQAHALRRAQARAA